MRVTSVTLFSCIDEMHILVYNTFNIREIETMVNDLTEREFNLLQRLYSATSNDDFDINVDISDFTPQEIRAVYFDLAIFNIIANNDKFEDVFDDGVMRDVVNGKFVLRRYSVLEAAQKNKQFKGQDQRSLNFKIKECQIQDGSYYYRKTSERTGTIYESVLETNVPSFYYNGEDFTNKLLPCDMLVRLRNIIAHSRKIYTDKQNGTVHFESDKYEFVCSQMWLRGFSTLWASRNKSLKENEIRNAIKKEFGEGKKSINSEEALKEILRLTSEFTGYKQNPSRMFTFVKNRLKYYTNYYGLVSKNGKEDFDKKIDIFINIIANNPNHIVGNKEVLNSKIIYNLQQIIADEQIRQFEKNGKVFSDSFDQDETKKMLTRAKSLADQHTEVVNKLNQHQKELMTRKGKTLELYKNRYKREIEALIRQEKVLRSLGHQTLDDARDNSSLESTKMDLFNKSSITNVPIEVAVNLVAFMGYNRFISSGFYQDALTDDATLTTRQKNEIMALDLSGFSFTRTNGVIELNGNQKQQKLENRITFLKRIRHATSHGLISYSIPQNSKNTSTMNDILMTYGSEGASDVKVTGKVADFYKLFSKDFFRPANNPFEKTKEPR